MTATLHSKGNSVPGSTIAAGELATISETKPRKRKEDEEVWSFAIAEALVREVPRWRGAATPEDTLRDDGNTAAPERRPSGSAAGPASGATPTQAPSSDAAFGVAEGGGPRATERLTTELSDSRLGRMELTVARGVSGLAIVINVADSHVKALIEADQAMLMKSLQDCGLRVASVRIGHSSGSGTGLAEEVTERVRASPTLSHPTSRRRAYRSSLDEESDADNEGVDFTA